MTIEPKPPRERSLADARADYERQIAEAQAAYNRQLADMRVEVDGRLIPPPHIPAEHAPSRVPAVQPEPIKSDRLEESLPWWVFWCAFWILLDVVVLGYAVYWVWAK